MSAKTQGVNAITQAGWMKRGAFWSARVITISSFWSLVCKGFFGEPNNTHSPCGNILSAIAVTLTWPLAFIQKVFGIDWLSDHLCGFLRYNELHNSKGDIITCELAEEKMKEIRSELKEMTSGEMTKERLESDWGITCEIVTSSQGGDGKVNRLQVEEKIGEKLRAGYQ